MSSIDIVKYPWHIGHDHELFKLNHRFHVVDTTHREWSSASRPFPDNVSFVSSVENAEADLMILHVDQWIFNEPDKYLLFRKLARRFGGKKIVINHGCNMVDGASSERMRELIGEYPVVCNSSTAHELWNLPDSRYIHHGMTPEEWSLSNYGRPEVIAVQPFGRMHAACRNNDAIEEFERSCGEKVTWIGRDKWFADFGAYRSFLASSSIAFFPAYASANPRARTECMFSGLAVVTTAAQGERSYIVNEHNGYASNNMRELHEYLVHLRHTPEDVRRIGANARKTAEERFHISRFLGEWNDLIEDVVLGERTARSPVVPVRGDRESGGRLDTALAA